MSWSDWAEAQCALVRDEGRWRQPRTLDADGPVGRLGDGREVVVFASNDYLGLASHPDVRRAAKDAVDRWGTGAGAARLVTGSRPVHDELEDELAGWKAVHGGDQRAVLFPTGYQANLGVLTALGVGGAVIVSDELNHASIVDGCRLARADTAVFRHRDLDHLDALLGGVERAVVVSDTVFSMDGDVCDVDGLADRCRHHDALLVLDEAHAVLGPEVCLDDVDLVRVGTLSKTLGSLGGFAVTSRPLAELLVNRARPYIFTTATSPADAAAALAAVRIVRSPEGRARVAHLRRLVDLLAPGHPSPVLPVVVGDERAAVDASHRLLEQGLLVPAIRPPTVAPGTSRLRIALSASHTEEQVLRLAEALSTSGLRERVAVA